MKEKYKNKHDIVEKKIKIWYSINWIKMESLRIKYNKKLKEENFG